MEDGHVSMKGWERGVVVARYDSGQSTGVLFFRENGASLSLSVGIGVVLLSVRCCEGGTVTGAGSIIGRIVRAH